MKCICHPFISLSQLPQVLTGLEAGPVQVLTGAGSRHGASAGRVSRQTGTDWLGFPSYCDYFPDKYNIEPQLRVNSRVRFNTGALHIYFYWTTVFASHMWLSACSCTRNHCFQRRLDREPMRAKTRAKQHANCFDRHITSSLSEIVESIYIKCV